MSENASTGSRAEFLARIQRFTDEMLESLIEASKAKDVDEKEVRTIRNSLLKSFRIWERVMREGYYDSRLEEMPKRAGKQSSSVKRIEGESSQKA